MLIFFHQYIKEQIRDPFWPLEMTLDNKHCITWLIFRFCGNAVSIIPADLRTWYSLYCRVHHYFSIPRQIICLIFVSFIAAPPDTRQSSNYRQRIGITGLPPPCGSRTAAQCSDAFKTGVSLLLSGSRGRIGSQPIFLWCVYRSSDIHLRQVEAWQHRLLSEWIPVSWRTVKYGSYTERTYLMKGIFSCQSAWLISLYKRIPWNTFYIEW